MYESVETCLSLLERTLQFHLQKDATAHSMNNGKCGNKRGLFTTMFLVSLVKS